MNGDKETGAVADTARAAGNEAYTLAGGENDQLVLFVAEVDNRTTKMCLSLDQQIFHTKAWNTFTRYSDYYKSNHTFKWFGLERGLNMPPITDHFHWCRSTLTYQIDFMQPLGSGDTHNQDLSANEKVLGVIDMDRIDEAIAYFKEKIRFSENEKAITIQKDGTVIQVEGDKNNVYPGGDLKDAIIIHNHPKEYEDEIAGSFGEDDMMFCAANGSFKELIAVDEKYDYSLKLKDGFEYSKYKDAYGDCDYEMDPDIKHCAMMKLQEMGFVTYERTERQ